MKDLKEKKLDELVVGAEIRPVWLEADRSFGT